MGCARFKVPPRPDARWNCGPQEPGLGFPERSDLRGAGSYGERLTVGKAWKAGAGAPTLSSARYRVTLETPQTIFQWQEAAVVVHVQNEGGLPVDGLLVVFQVDPPRARYASIRPARARTQGGRVRAIVRSDLVGQVRFTVRVGALTKRATIMVVVPIATGDGHADAYRS